MQKEGKRNKGWRRNNGKCKIYKMKEKMMGKRRGIGYEDKGKEKKDGRRIIEKGRKRGEGTRGEEATIKRE